jgi:hypothetical protein
VKNLIKKSLLFCFLFPLHTFIKGQELPDYLKDRGPGISTSLFGTYIEKGNVIIYPFFEYYYEKNSVYHPGDFGFDADREYAGKFTATEELIYLGYGITDWLMIEGEASIIQAKQRRATDDHSGMPASVTEQGLENIEGQLRWRYWSETAGKPELYSYFLTVLPTSENKKLIGTKGWEFKLGSGITKGFSFGTLTLSTAIEYNTEDQEWGFGGVTLEYLKRVSDKFRFYIGLESFPDATEAILDLQFHLSPRMFIRLNNAIGIKSAATDIAPEVGILFYLNK